MTSTQKSRTIPAWHRRYHWYVDGRKKSDTVSNLFEEFAEVSIDDLQQYEWKNEHGWTVYGNFAAVGTTMTRSGITKARLGY